MLQKYSRNIVIRTSSQAVVQTPPNLVNTLLYKLDITKLVTSDEIIAAMIDEEEISFGWRDFIWYFTSEISLPQQDNRVRLVTTKDEDKLEN